MRKKGVQDHRKDDYGLHVLGSAYSPKNLLGKGYLRIFAVSMRKDDVRIINFISTQKQN